MNATQNYYMSVFCTSEIVLSGSLWYFILISLKVQSKSQIPGAVYVVNSQVYLLIKSCNAKNTVLYFLLSSDTWSILGKILCPHIPLFPSKKNRRLTLNSQHCSTTQRFYWEKSGFMVFLMILWRNNFLIMWHGGWVCYMLWSTRETELWLQLKVGSNLESSIIKNKILAVLPFFVWCSFWHRVLKVCSRVFGITGELAHALRFLASVVSQSFIAFGDILELHKKFLELSGGINRIFELEELLQASQSSKCQFILKFSGSSSR